jgi:hypothetical protein
MAVSAKQSPEKNPNQLKGDNQTTDIQRSVQLRSNLKK